ncbi:RNA-binding protein 34 [Geranomyces michiganensis]|nr:RNA-binding protein 34 [Geranomyces michiganensis]
MPGIAQSLFGGVALDPELDALFASATAEPKPAAKSKKRKSKDVAPEDVPVATPKKAKKSKKADRDTEKPLAGDTSSTVNEGSTPSTVTKGKKDKKAAKDVAASADTPAAPAVAALPAEPSSAAKKQKNKKATGDAVAPAASVIAEVGTDKKVKKAKSPKKDALTMPPSTKNSAHVKSSQSESQAGKTEERTESTNEDARGSTIAEGVQMDIDSDSDASGANEDDSKLAPEVKNARRNVKEENKGKTPQITLSKNKVENEPVHGDSDSNNDSDNDGIEIDIDGEEAGTDGESDSDADGPDKEVKKTRRQVKEETNEKNRRTVFIGNLSLKVTEKTNIKALKAMFSPHGAIESIRFRSIARNKKMPRRAAFITKDFHPGRETLNAYLVYKEKDSAAKALTENGKLFLGNHIRVDKAMREKDEKHEYKRSVFVGGLPFDISEEKVWEFFAQCGDVEGVRIVRDKATNVGKGIGYVLFKDKACVALGMKLHGSELAGRKIRVNRCKDTSAEGKAKRLSEIEGARASRSDPVKGGVSKFRTRNQNKSEIPGRAGRGGAIGSAGRGRNAASAAGAQGAARRGATLVKDSATKIKPPQLGKAAYQRAQAAAKGVTYVKKERHVPRTPKK